MRGKKGGGGGEKLLVIGLAALVFFLSRLIGVANNFSICSNFSDWFNSKNFVVGGDASKKNSSGILPWTAELCGKKRGKGGRMWWDERTGRRKRGIPIMLSQSWEHLCVNKQSLYSGSISFFSHFWCTFPAYRRLVVRASSCRGENVRENEGKEKRRRERESKELSKQNIKWYWSLWNRLNIIFAGFPNTKARPTPDPLWSCRALNEIRLFTQFLFCDCHCVVLFFHFFFLPFPSFVLFYLFPEMLFRNRSFM